MMYEGNAHALPQRSNEPMNASLVWLAGQLASILFCGAALQLALEIRISRLFPDDLPLQEFVAWTLTAIGLALVIITAVHKDQHQLARFHRDQTYLEHLAASHQIAPNPMQPLEKGTSSSWL
jgi:hypothetical protein